MSEETAELIPYEYFSKLDVRIAEVFEARPHPNADKLLLLKVKVGTDTKQIVAGIRKHYDAEQLVGSQIVIINNLQPAVLRGEESEGMLLAASDADGVVLVRPERTMEAGAKVK